MMMAMVVWKHQQHTQFGPGIINFSLEFLLLQAMFKAHEDGRWFAVDITILHHGDHAIAIHRFTGEELEIFEAAEDVLHNHIAVGLEHINLVWCVFF